MSFDCVPLEILQAILNNLPFDELLKKSLVCRRWSQAAATLISRRCWLVVHAARVHEVSVLRESQRIYNNVLIHQLNERNQMQQVLDICTQRVRLRKLKICRALVDCLYWFYQEYSSWLDGVEAVVVSIDHRFLKHDAFSGKSYSIELRNTRMLHWSENHLRRGNRTVTIRAAGLRRVSINDSFGSKLNVILPDCDRIEQIECTLYRKSFQDIFRCSFKHLNTLILRIYSTVQSVDFLRHLGSLKRLSLSLEYEKDQLPLLLRETVDAICSCKYLEALRLHIMNTDSSTCSISLSQLARSLQILQQLELNNLCLKSTEQFLGFQRLSVLKLHNIVLKHEVDRVVLDFPVLKSIHVSRDLLPRLHIEDNGKSCMMHVNLDSINFSRAIDSCLVQFLQRTPHIQNLVLINSECYDALDLTIPRTVSLNITGLHLVNLSTPLDCLENVVKCQRLKHLKLTRCTISTSGHPEKQLILSQLESLSLDGVQLDDRAQTKFPIVRNSHDLISGEEVYSSLIVFNLDSSGPFIEEPDMLRNNVILSI